MSKLIVCEKCFAELNTATGFCPHCGARIVNKSGFDIYNKGDKFYLRYRKGTQRAQTPLAPNFTSLPYDSRKTIYTNAKKSLDAKLAAKSLLVNSSLSKLDTFGDVLDNYIYNVYINKVKGTGKQKIKIGSFESHYVSKQRLLKHFSICSLQLKDINYESLKWHIDRFITQRITGEVTGKPVGKSTINSELLFINTIITYAYDEELLTVPYAKIRKLIKYTQDVSPTADDTNAKPRSTAALSAKQFDLFLREFFRQPPKETFQDIFYPIILSHTTDKFVIAVLLFCLKKYTTHIHSVNDILLNFREHELRLLPGDFYNPWLKPDCQRFFIFVKRTYDEEAPKETWENYFRNTLDSAITNALELFPVCYQELINKLENNLFNGTYYPVLKSYYHDKEHTIRRNYDPTKPNSHIVYKAAPKHYIPNIYFNKSYAVALLLLLSQTGMRLNEAASLRVGDISEYQLSNGTVIKTISIQHQTVYSILVGDNGVPLTTENGCMRRQFTEGTPKTESSKRIIPLTPLAELAINIAMRNKDISYIDTNSHLFGSESANWDTYEPKRWLRIMLDNIRCYNISGCHTLRRTVASQLAQHGYSEVVIGQILGHSEKSITEHYITIDIEHKYKALCESVMPDWFNNALPKEFIDPALEKLYD